MNENEVHKFTHLCTLFLYVSFSAPNLLSNFEYENRIKWMSRRHIAKMHYFNLYRSQDHAMPYHSTSHSTCNKCIKKCAIHSIPTFKKLKTAAPSYTPYTPHANESIYNATE